MVNRDTVAAELDRIYRMAGAVTPAGVVEAARPEQAPLHPVFEWDDAVAAEQHRLWQARQLIRTVVIRTESGAVEPAYVHVTTSDGDGQYLPTRVVVQDVDLFESAVDELVGKIRGLQRAVSTLERLSREAGRDDRIEPVLVAAQALDAAVGALSAPA